MTALEIVGKDIELDETPPPTHTWRPESLIRLARNPPAPPTIGGLLYPGKRTVLSGETESMKTWLALILCKAELDIGLHVAWVDLDAMGSDALLERLQLLGVQDDAIDERFVYYQPSEMLDPAKKTEIAETIRERQIRLFVIDAFNPILTLHGLDPNSTTDIEKFWQGISAPIEEAGAAPCLLDHVTKNAETRGKYAYGSERKASGAIVHIGFRLLDALAKGGSGRTLLTVHKDRPGYLPRPTLGRLILDATGSTIAYKLEHDKAHDGDRFRPTILMERISRRLETEPEPVSKNWVESNIDGSTDALRIALDVLHEEGYADRQQGPRNALLYTTLRPYREVEDTPADDLAPTSPHLASDLRSLPDLDFAPTRPFRGEEARSDQETGGSEGRPRLSSPTTVFSENGKAHEYDHPLAPIALDQEPDPDELEY
jgi:hypothetical protein